MPPARNDAEHHGRGSQATERRRERITSSAYGLIDARILAGSTLRRTIMQSSLSFLSVSGLARVSARRPWLVVAGWVLALLLAVGGMGILGDSTTTEVTFLDNPESMRGNDLLVASGLRTKDPITETVIVRADAATVDDP